jgi:hypothetical protein
VDTFDNGTVTPEPPDERYAQERETLEQWLTDFQQRAAQSQQVQTRLAWLQGWFAHKEDDSA